MRFEDIIPGRLVRHFKGGLYLIIGISYDSESEDRQTVLYYSIMRKRLYSRPARRMDCRLGEKAFMESVERDGSLVQRFEFIADSDPLAIDKPTLEQAIMMAYNEINKPDNGVRNEL